MPSFKTLMKIATVGGIVTVYTAYFISYKYHQRLHESNIYKEALSILRSHEKAVKHLGEPIQEGKARFTYADDTVRRFVVNLLGSNTQGQLNCEFVLKEPQKQHELTKLEIKFNDIPNRIFVIQEA